MRYYISFPDTALLDDAGPFAFRSRGAEGLADELRHALRTDTLFERWRATQDDPDAVDPALGATDPQADVDAGQRDLQVEMVVRTRLPGALLRERLRLLAGAHWRLNDVKSD